MPAQGATRSSRVGASMPNKGPITTVDQMVAIKIRSRFLPGARW